MRTAESCPGRTWPSSPPPRLWPPRLWPPSPFPLPRDGGEGYLFPSRSLSLSPLGRGQGEGRYMIHPSRGVVPKVHPSAWIAESADVIGEPIHRSAKIYMSLAGDYRAAQAR